MDSANYENSNPKRNLAAEDGVDSSRSRRQHVDVSDRSVSNPMDKENKENCNLKRSIADDDDADDGRISRRRCTDDQASVTSEGIHSCLIYVVAPNLFRV